MLQSFLEGDTAVVVPDKSRSLEERRKTKGIQTGCCPTKSKKRKTVGIQSVPGKQGEKERKKDKFRTV
jgi:SRSO17 transposase